MTNGKPVWIVRAKRTPQGPLLALLAKYSAVDLANRAAAAVLDGIDRARVDSVIVGNVLSAGQGMNVARQVSIGAELPVTTPAFTVNMMCASWNAGSASCRLERFKMASHRSFFVAELNPCPMPPTCSPARVPAISSATVN